VLRELQVADYYEGPKRETLYGGADMWIFGKTIKGQEVYKDYAWICRSTGHLYFISCCRTSNEIFKKIGYEKSLYWW
jgi:hypothetical protein